MKQFFALLLTALMIAAALVPCLVVPSEAAGNALDLYVSVNGSGTKDASSPANAATLDTIQEIVKTKKAGKDVVVHLADGNYVIKEALTFTGDDSADVDHSITYLGSGNTHISGGVEITGWKSEGNNVWSVSLPDVEDVNGLYINGERKRYASGKIKAQVFKSGTTKIYWESSDEIISKLMDEPCVWLELVKDQRWWHHFMLIDSIEKSGKKYKLNGDKQTSLAIIYGHGNGLWNNETIFAGPDEILEYTISNARCLMDEEGEYYFDQAKHVLYYYSATSPVGKKTILPQSEQLLVLQGTEDRLVYGLNFRNITFEYGTTFYYHHNPFLSNICDQGWVSEMTSNGKNFIHSIAGGTQMPVITRIAAVFMDHVTHIGFKNNDLIHCYTLGIHLQRYCYNVDIANNYFTDLSGGGIEVNYPDSVNIHAGWTKAVMPKDYLTMTKGNDLYHYHPESNTYGDDEGYNWLNININITNNYITKIGVEYQSSVGIHATGYKINIINNTISHVPFTGIAPGGQGTGNRYATWINMMSGEVLVKANYIEYMVEVLRDTAAIHGGGVCGNGPCIIEDNFVAHSGERNPGNQWTYAVGLYLDTGADNYIVRHNLVNDCKNWLQFLDWSSSGEYGSLRNNTITDNFYGSRQKTSWLLTGLDVPNTENVFERNELVADWYNHDEIRAIAENAGVQEAFGTTATQASVRLPDKGIPAKGNPETEPPETKAPETKAPETKAPETKAPETKAPETKAPETKAPETKAPETKAPETKAPETKAPETEAPETKPADTETVPVTDPATEPETKAETKAETQVSETEKPSETKAPETKAPDNKNNGGLPVGAIIGIVAGVVVVGGGAAFFLIKRKK